MFLRWPIKQKLLICLLLLSCALAVLSISGAHGVYSFRALIKGIRQRTTELPLATMVVLRVSELRQTHQQFADSMQQEPMAAGSSPRGIEPRFYGQAFRDRLAAVHGAIEPYREIVAHDNPAALSIAEITDLHQERETLAEIDDVLRWIDQLKDDPAWTTDADAVETMKGHLDRLSQLSIALPKLLKDRMYSFSDGVRIKYRALIVLTWVASVLAIALLFLLGWLFYAWVLRPLRLLIHGSRQVACGDFRHRIQLASQDEMAELAHAMNSMTARFQEIRDDLDRQVQERTREVVRSEQLASVGFLAAGVAHEINNPLATIALCAESLEDRLDEIIQKDDALPDEEHNEEIANLRNYLRMMQDEAFRCKEITERLLDFSRLGEVERVPCDLGSLVHDVVGMLGHLGKYKGKQVQLDVDDQVGANVNAREFKQVLLNLITNGLDSVDPGGWVKISLKADGTWVRLTVTDNGCGMTEEVKRHLFEPFFTRRRDGQGTGLGMSISYRIVHEHGGTIVADSAGVGRGATIVVTLPLMGSGTYEVRESRHYHQAA